MSFVVSKEGVHQMNAYSAWDDYCRENNIEDPWELIDSIESEYTTYQSQDNGGTLIIVNDPTPEQEKRLRNAKYYRDNYIQDRRLWIAKYILENYGYDELINFVQLDSGGGRSGPPSDFAVWLSSVRPCEGKTGECSIFCPDFNNCNRKF